MKFIFTLTCVLLFSVQLPAVTGNLDSSFGTNGFTSVFINGSDFARDVVVQPDDKIIVAGTSQTNGNQDFSLTRLNPDGTLDTGFGANGKVLTPFNQFDSLEQVWAVALQSDGKIVLAGTFSVGSGTLVALARYNPDGSLDGSFDGDGKVTASVGFISSINDIAIQSDGKIVVTGSFVSPTDDFIVVRFNTEGTLDTSFDNDGIVTTPVGTSSGHAYAIAIQGDGKIVVGGTTFVGGFDAGFAIVRYNQNGSLDTTFGNQGIAINKISNSSAQDRIYSLVIQPNGKIVGVGVSIGGGVNSALARYNSDGSLDPSFGIGGKVITSISSRDDLLSDVVLQPNGKLVVSGFMWTIDNYYDFVVGRFNSDGTPDSSFGIGGFASAAFSTGEDQANAIALQSDGKIITVGTGAGGFIIARFPAHGLRFADFEGDGKSDFSIYRPSLGEWWYLRSSDSRNRAFQFGNSTDKIIPADYTGDDKTDIAFWRPSTGEWFILRSEDSSFYSFPFGLASDIPAPADYDGDGKADAAVFRSSTATWFILKSTGETVIQQFGASGDLPVVGDYDGDGKADLAIYRPSVGQWWYLRSSDKRNLVFQFGNTTDKPVPADYTGDGKTDVAVFRPSTGEWFVLRSENQSFYSFPFGTNGDVPAPGDYDGDGKSDAAVFRPSNNTWFVQRSTSGTLIQTFGQTGDKPVPNAFVP